MNFNKLLTFAAAAIYGLLASTPPSVHIAALVALWLFSIDTTTGIVSVRVRGLRISSSEFRNKLASKMAIYLGILGIAVALAVFGQTWQFIVAGWYSIVAAESISIGENVRPMLASAGPAFAPVARLFDRFLGEIDATTVQASAGKVTAPLAGELDQDAADDESSTAIAASATTDPSACSQLMTRRQFLTGAAPEADTTTAGTPANGQASPNA